eukprot:874224-Rhodomonas_salina.1
MSVCCPQLRRQIPPCCLAFSFRSRARSARVEVYRSSFLVAGHVELYMQARPTVPHYPTDNGRGSSPLSEQQ